MSDRFKQAQIEERRENQRLFGVALYDYRKRYNVSLGYLESQAKMSRAVIIKLEAGTYDSVLDEARLLRLCVSALSA